MTRFTLEPKTWYACLLLGDEFDGNAMCSMSPSPIYVQRVTPRHSGDRTFDLAFFHANYPSGIQDKVYGLRTIHRGERGLLAATTDHDPPRFLYVTVITRAWLEHNFPRWIIGDESLQQWLTRAFN